MPSLGGLASLGRVKGEHSVRRVPRIPKDPRIYLRFEKLPIVRDHQRPPVEFGDPELEQRAIPPDMFPGATLGERVMYKKLWQLIGQNAFVYQKAEFGGRNIIGGFSIDFVITDRMPLIALETTNEYWHRAEFKYHDLERALVLQGLGYRYEEVPEFDIFMSDEHLELILLDILGGKVNSS
jgi:very-short-patch-repair endonuclease